MQTKDIAPALAALFHELMGGAAEGGGAFVLNSGDKGLMSALDALTASEASASVLGGATAAAHARHVTYGLELLNRWAVEGADAYANPQWDEAWKTSTVNEAQWREILDSLRHESRRWGEMLQQPRAVSEVELRGMIASIAHVAYHMGAMRQIARNARGPREGTFPTSRS